MGAKILPVGIYVEQYEGTTPGLPSIHSAIVDEIIPDRDLIVQYLKSGEPAIDILDNPEDIIDPTKNIYGGSSLITDGTWVWRQDTIHYLENYPIALNPDFLAHVRELNYTPPKVVITREMLDNGIRDYF